MFWALGLTLGIACVHPTDIRNGVKNAKVIPVWIDSEFGQHDIDMIKNSIEKWNASLNGNIVLTIIEKIDMKKDASKKLKEIERTNLGWVIVKFDSNSVIVQEMPESVLGFSKIGGHLMGIIRDRVGTRNMNTIILHEIGHLLGARDVNVPGSLMFGTYNFKQGTCIDKVTAAQVAYYQELKLADLNYCPIESF